MILKIKRWKDKQSWWILDDIRKMSISERLTMKRDELEKHLEIVHYDINILDGMATSSECPPGDIKYKELICKRTDGEEFSVVFDTVAYLCNDEGKTVEKITV